MDGQQLQHQQHQQQGVYVDAVAGRHATTDVGLLLDRRGLVWRKDFGWTYDAWVDRNEYSLSGANGRFSLPAMARGVQHGLLHAASKAKDVMASHHLWSQQASKP
mmetsp:Transcript_8593/g.23088  ORF Transcript_8593/g.23088 Transcript_8593/m.23088 type:complete len:105 (+) Transcript_8593:201-515(+)